MLSRRLHAKSIRLHHPLLHLTFQGTCISSLCCQTFSTCYFALVPYVNSSSVPWGWAGRSGSAKVDVKVGVRVRLGPLNSRPLLASPLCVFFPPLWRQSEGKQKNIYIYIYKKKNTSECVKKQFNHLLTQKKNLLSFSVRHPHTRVKLKSEFRHLSVLDWNRPNYYLRRFK